MVHNAPLSVAQAPAVHGHFLKLRSDGSHWKDDEFDYDLHFFKMSLQRGGNGASGALAPPKSTEFQALNESELLKIEFDPLGSLSAHKAIQRNNLRAISKKHNLAFVQQATADTAGVHVPQVTIHHTPYTTHHTPQPDFPQ